MKVMGITVVLLLALIGGGVVLLGGGAFFMQSKVEARAAEFEEAMMAGMSRCAPKGWSKDLLDAQRVMVKQLARTAAQMEMAEALKGKGQGSSDEILAAAASGIECPKVATGIGQSSPRRPESSHQYQQESRTNMDRKDWKFGDPISDPSKR